MFIRQFSTILMACFFLMLGNQTLAQDNETKGKTIVKKMIDQNSGWQTMTTNMSMKLTNRHGDSSTRKIRMKSLEVENDGDKSITIFDSPKDVKGTAFLSYSHGNRPDEQWLYLPALKRVKRINSKNKSGPFMGSEFSYEDLSSIEIEKYSYRYLNQEVVNKLDCHVIEFTPLYKHSGYTKLTYYIDIEELRPQKVEFYDRKKALLKTLTYSKYNKKLDQYWFAEIYEMVNHQSGKTTKLHWTNQKLKTELNSSDFTPNAIKRMR